MLLASLAVNLSTHVPLQVSHLSHGKVISRSVRIKKTRYLIAHADETGKSSAIQIKGNNIVVDFGGSTLAGSKAEVLPSDRKGLGILVSGNNITIKNLTVTGYKIGLIAKKCTGLILSNCNFSYNWKQRLGSTVEKEDESDWMSYHHNENSEWLRYGAGIYLDDCSKFEIKNIVITGGQCALMLNRSNNGLIWNNDFSFNSAIGLGMYRSSSNRIMHNKMDWCVRGYSHGVYNRGQDSSGILVFEQCNNNVFAYNSATHGGDGFFLWAGQETMDSGKGGCNDNLLFANDFSHSPCNAIEATFSRNRFVNNLLIDSWHGVWGGYSYESEINGNVFGFNGESIAIEHGQNNKILGNSFYRDMNSIRLWQNSGKPDPNWGYPKYKDTSNMGTEIAGNSITNSQLAIEVATGQKISITGNAIASSIIGIRATGIVSDSIVSGNSAVAKSPLQDSGMLTKSGNSFSENLNELAKPWMTAGGNSLVQNEPLEPEYGNQWKQFSWNGKWQSGFPKPLAGAKPALDPWAKNRGRKYILIDEWGPYDFKRPYLWLRKLTIDSKTGEQIAQFEVLGPKGKWTLEKPTEGAKVTRSSGSCPGSLEARWAVTNGNIKIPLIYRGAETTDFRGIRTPKGSSVRFGWTKSYTPISWTVNFWAWDQNSDPRTSFAKFEALADTKPLVSKLMSELSFASGESPFDGVPADHFSTVATGSFASDSGDYDLTVTSDDGVRVFLDGKQIIDEWHWQAPTTFNRTVSLNKGTHNLTVKHFEIDGYTALKVGIKRKS